MMHTNPCLFHVIPRQAIVQYLGPHEFNNDSQERSLSFSQRFVECDTTSDWLNHTV